MGDGYDSIPSVESSAPAHKPLMKELIAEAFGTCTLTQIGCGGLCAMTYMGVMSGLWQAASIWLVGATLAISATASISGAHLNPAVTLAFAFIRPADFPKSKILPFWIAQLVGGIVAGCINLVIFGAAINQYEIDEGIERGSPEGIASAGAFGDYWSLSSGVSGPLHALFIEAFGTAFLTFVIFSATHANNSTVKDGAVPLIVGTGIGTMIALLGSLTGAGINPARDFGPRLVTLFAGWGTPALTDAWVYIVGPLIGGPIGAFIADILLM